MKIIFILLLTFYSLISHAQVWQWSIPVQGIINQETNANPQAFLWIPENCKQVKGVVLCMHNMVEEGMLENVIFRKKMTEIGFAEIWVTPSLDVTFDFQKGIQRNFQTMMDELAAVSGYSELSTAPIVPMGHSALASYPWNFGAWNPNRTLAIVSIHGDSPLTKLTGSGRPNPDWGNRTIEGVPSLFVMGEFEWWEKRIEPGFEYVAKHPKTPISFFADAGHGHFDYSNAMVDYVAMFLKKAAHYRLPKQKNQPLIPINPIKGWLMDRWRKDSLPLAKPQPYLNYEGDRKVASWCFDKEMVNKTEDFYAKARSKKEQHLGLIQDGTVLNPVKTHANFQLKFIPLADGISFRLKAFFADTSRVKSVSNFAKTPLQINRICGPVKKLDDSTFQLSFYRMGFNNLRRSNDIWLLAYNEGDEIYKSAVQQLNMRFPLKNTEGILQKINFQSIKNQKIGVREITLNATSSADLPIGFYVKEGAAYIENGKLIFTKIPTKTKFPMKITVVAWQYGIAGKVQSAEPVEQTFELHN
ncbi:MAG: hypothetical protein V4585_14195 [Bacteroidota bacterium]